jgi:hypothetical protein
VQLSGSNYLSLAEVEVFGIASSILPIDSPSIFGSGIYDDRFSNIAYSGNWITANVNGAYSNTITYSGDLESYADFSFRGNNVGLLYSGVYNRGYAEIYIDGILVSILNMYSPTWVPQSLWISPILDDKDHKITIRTKSSYIDIDAIIVY